MSLSVSCLLRHTRRSVSFLVIRNTSGVASYGHWGRVPPPLPTISFLVYFRVNLTADYPSIVYSLPD